MDHNKHQSGGSSSFSFTENLFGPKDASSASSSGLFSSVFGPASTTFKLVVVTMKGSTASYGELLRCGGEPRRKDTSDGEFGWRAHTVHSYCYVSVVIDLLLYLFQGLGRDASHSKNSGASKQHEYRGPYGSGKQLAPEYKGQRSMGEKEGNPMYQNETAAEPSYPSSSIYYGGQEVYSSNTQTTRPHHTFKKDGGDDDPNGSSASRGNWWQGSLYY